MAERVERSDEQVPSSAATGSSGQDDVLRVLQTKEETRSFYNKISKVYDLLSEHTEEPMRRAGLEKLAAREGETILEIGFGTGHSLVELAKSVGDSGSVLGVDLSENMLELSEKLLEHKGLGRRAQLQCADAERLPYDSESIDGIFTAFTLELFDTPDIPLVLAEYRRVLRPGGRIVVVGISKEGKQSLIVQAFEWTHRHFPNLMDCRPIHVRRALEAADFAVRDWEVQHMWVPVELVLAEKPAKED